MADNDVDFQFYVDQSPSIGTEHHLAYHKGATRLVKKITAAEASAIVAASDEDRPEMVKIAFGPVWVQIPLNDRDDLLAQVNPQVAASKALFG